MTAEGAAGSAELLRYARGVLNQQHGIPALQAPRAAALLARQALEDVVAQLCLDHGADLRDATMRSRLICLRQLADPPVPDWASTAWNGLSGLCHHHAYRLTPTVGEVGHLIEQVASLVAQRPGNNEPTAQHSRSNVLPDSCKR